MNALLQLFRRCFILPLWANPNTAAGVLPLRDLFAERVLSKLKVHDPGFPRDDPPPEPSTFPTDVPAPEPHDVPTPEPIDPPPDPSEEPPVKPPERPGQDPKPRPIP